MKIRGNINNILELGENNTLLAPYDAYPNLDWKLDSQFEKESNIFPLLNERYDLSIAKYFQTGILFFDSKIINTNTKRDLINLTEQFPISKTNEQGIMNLYFIFEKNIFSQFPLELNNEITYSYWKIKNKISTITKRDIYEYEK